MKNIYLNIYKANYSNLKKAKKILENNSVIGLPTETVYGLAGNAYSTIAVKKIFKLKKRPSFNPLIIHFKDLYDLQNDALVNNDFKKLYKAFCPGPLTFILKKKKKSRISKIAYAGQKTIAVRFPKHKSAKKLLEILACPLTKGPLIYDNDNQELISISARLAYPIRDDIPIMIEEEARKISEEEMEKFK